MLNLVCASLPSVCDIGGKTQDLVHVRQVVYDLNCLTSWCLQSWSCHCNHYDQNTECIYYPQQSPWSSFITIPFLSTLVLIISPNVAEGFQRPCPYWTHPCIIGPSWVWAQLLIGDHHKERQQYMHDYRYAVFIHISQHLFCQINLSLGYFEKVNYNCVSDHLKQVMRQVTKTMP